MLYLRRKRLVTLRNQPPAYSTFAFNTREDAMSLVECVMWWPECSFSSPAPPQTEVTIRFNSTPCEWLPDLEESDLVTIAQ